MQCLSDQYALTARAREVLQSANEGKSNPATAQALCISENTVKRHINSILRKTESHNRHEVLFKLANANRMDRG